MPLTDKSKLLARVACPVTHPYPCEKGSKCSSVDCCNGVFMDIYDPCCPNDIVTCHRNPKIKCRGNPSVTTNTTTCTTTTTSNVAISNSNTTTTTAAPLTTTTTCQPPSGYTYETTVDKYYKSVKDNVTWHSAKDACSSEGSMLVELRTLAEYQAIRQVFGMSFNSHDISIN